MPKFPIMMPILFIILLFLPIRVPNLQLKALAYLIWVFGGIVLLMRGVTYLVVPAMLDYNSYGMPMLAGLIALALAIGYAKGKFVLSKTARRNIERIDQFTTPQKPILVYSVRSWIVIALMIGISISLNIMAITDLARGLINLAIGFGLIMSSLVYMRALRPIKSAQ